MAELNTNIVRAVEEKSAVAAKKRLMTSLANIGRLTTVQLEVLGQSAEAMAPKFRGEPVAEVDFEVLAGRRGPFRAGEKSRASEHAGGVRGRVPRR